MTIRTLFTDTMAAFFTLTLTLAPAFAQTAPSQAMQDLQTLSSTAMQGREMGSAGNGLAREYILKRLHELGLHACGEDFIQNFDYKDRRGETKSGKNILACQTGAKKDTASMSIVVSAHYDHLGNQKGAIYFGADDNASGVAGVLAVAKFLQAHAPKNNIVYAFFDGEEKGLIGSNAFVKQAKIPLSQIAVNLNFDMIARGDKNELFVSGSHQTPSFKTLLQGLNGTQGIHLLFDHDRPEQGNDDWTNQSDHHAFFKAGIPHLYFGVEDHKDYHKASDTADKVNPHFFDGSVEIVSKAVALIDEAVLKTDFRAERSRYSGDNK